MAKLFQKDKSFRLSPLDKQILPVCEFNLDLWMQGYFDGNAFPYQSYFYHQPQQDKLLIAGIRTGKSRLAAMAALHFCQYNPASRFLNTSISSEQAKIVFRSCIELAQAPKFQHWISSVQSSPYPCITMANGSELWFRSVGYDGELLRGFEFDFINVDEAAYITRESTIDTLKGRLLGYNQVLKKPRAAIFWMMSSPRGKGWLNDRWKKGDPLYPHAHPEEYLSLRARTFDNPMLSEKDLMRLAEDYTEAMIRQEFFGEFVSDDANLFPYDMVMAGCDNEEREVQWLYTKIEEWNARYDSKATSFRAEAGLTEDISHYEVEPEPGHRYVNSWDLGKKAKSNGRNAMVGMVFDVTFEPWKMVAYRYKEGMGYVQAKGEIESWHEKYSGRGSSCSSVIDSTGKGDVMLEFMEEENTMDDIEGITYSSTTKPNLLHAAKISLERGMVRYPFIKKVVDQLSQYEVNDETIAQDTVMAFAQAMHRARLMAPPISNRPSLLVARKIPKMPQYAYRNPSKNPVYIQSRMARHGIRRGTLGAVNPYRR